MKSKIRKDTGSARGFTLVETMFVVLLLGLLASLSIPGFIRNRQASQAAVCRDSLRLINSGIQQYMLENSVTNVPAITDPELGIYFQVGAAPTNCPTGVLYQMPATGDEAPTCPIGYPHTFPWDASQGF